MKVKLKTILHIGKIVCEVGAIALGIAALCTPAAGVVIAGVVVGAVAWGLGQAEEVIEHNFVEADCGHDSPNASDKSKDDLYSGDDDGAVLINYIDDYNIDNTIINIDDILASGDHSCIVYEV